MSERPEQHAPSSVAWKRQRHDRRWYRKVAGEPLAEATVESPHGKTYLVRVRKNSPIVLSPVASGSDPLSAVLGVAKASWDAAGNTGWRIDVIAPARGWKGERVLYTQQVGARPIVVGVILAVTDALERGDRLWPDDDE